MDRTKCPHELNFGIFGNKRTVSNCLFNYRGTVLWNGLSNEIKAEPSIASFKAAL